MGDIADPEAVAGGGRGLRRVVNFAAESHVDRSIESPGRVHPDRRLRHLRPARGRPRRRRSATSRSRPTRSTGRSSRARSPRTRPLDPSSPYSASKAGGDLIVGAFHHTYGADALIVRASNNYGPHQHPEKLIPLCVLNALAGDPLPVYGDGMQVRNWLFVEDFCAGDRPGARARRAGPGLQRRRSRRAAQHRGRAADPRAHRPRRVADRVRHATVPATTAATRWPPSKVRELGWEAAGRLRGGPERPSTGTATTSGGGSRSAPASTASTTSASTAERWADGSGDSRRGSTAWS